MAVVPLVVAGEATAVAMAELAVAAMVTGTLTDTPGTTRQQPRPYQSSTSKQPCPSHHPSCIPLGMM